MFRAPRHIARGALVARGDAATPREDRMTVGAAAIVDAAPGCPGIPRGIIER